MVLKKRLVFMSRSVELVAGLQRRWLTVISSLKKFSVGQLPIAEGIKLNDFLGTMLKSKQSRLTKKDEECQAQL